MSDRLIDEAKDGASPDLNTMIDRASAAPPQSRLVRETGERDLRLDHPDSEMAAGVRVIGAEGRPEGVDLGQCQPVGLEIELPRDRQECLAAEEILREIQLLV